MSKIFFLTLLFATDLCTRGIDYSDRVSSQIECFVQNGYEFAIPRGYCSYGDVDPNVVANLQSAWDGGMKYVDVYLFPCVPCGNPRDQVDSLIDALSGSTYGMIWVDVEIYKWNADQDINRQFILDMVEQIKARGKVPGIYSSYYNWQNICGLDWTGVNDLPLWYAHYDNDPSFNDFRPFGGFFYF